MKCLKKSLLNDLEQKLMPCNIPKRLDTILNSDRVLEF